MPRDLLGKIQRGLRKPPRYILSRLFHEAISKTEVIRGPRRARALTDQKLTRFAGVTTLEELWEKLASRPYVAEPFEKIDADAYETMCPGDTQRILDAAARALAHRVELMGSGDVDLGEIIDWHRDYKVGQNWPPTYWSSIDYNNPDRPSDVKFPWELSRVQWLIPCGQAYALTGDESYAECARNVLDHWIDENPYASSINWACTMEVALRILTWSCLFHFFKRSDAWSSREFRGKFLRSLYLHADFTRRHLEKSDINGNHYTADAAGLVFAAAFFGAMGDAETWGKLGWTILLEELPLQVFPDGVDFEASVPYHRLVQELFLLPALYRTRIGESVPQTYLDRLEGMARFTASYSRDDGSTPYWGDADDARSLPFGFQGLNDHRYLLALSAALLENDALRKSFSGSRTEAAWLLGLDATSNLPDEASSELKLSKAFRDGGFFILRSPGDHVFVDCGPMGLKGRGGHGHNDLLSFEASLRGVHLVSDRGSYVYTADYAARNEFRNTSSHNTPQIDGEDINREIRPDFIWMLRNDADPVLREWNSDSRQTRLIVSHTGYQRLSSAVSPVRTFVLDHENHRLNVTDEFEGEGEHLITTPLHFAPGVTVHSESDHSARLETESRDFRLSWNSEGDWTWSIESSSVSPSYGVKRPCQKIVWRLKGKPSPLSVQIAPADSNG